MYDDKIQKLTVHFIYSSSLYMKRGKLNKNNTKKKWLKNIIYNYSL